MFSGIVSILLFVLRLFGIGKAESEAHQAERLTRESLNAQVEAERFASQAHAQANRDQAEQTLARIALVPPAKDRPKLRPGDKLFLAVVLFCAGQMGCATKAPPAPLPSMAMTCPAIPLPPRPDITVPQPSSEGLYCFSEDELAKINYYAQQLRRLIEAYNDTREAPQK